MKLNRLIHLVSVASIFFGAVLLIINLYGLTQNIRPSEFHMSDLRFKADISTKPYEESILAIHKDSSEQVDAFLQRLSHLISQSIAHVQWERVDPRRYNQLIPAWENYFLYFMGVWSGIPEFERYHYTDYVRSLKRGIGICGDASIIMSGILNDNYLSNKIVSFPGHVVVSVDIGGAKQNTYDPDFGISLPFSVGEIHKNPDLITPYYSEKGYGMDEIRALQRAYELPYKEWDGVSHFLTNKYYFEKFAYVMKWPFPIALIIIGLYFRKRLNRKVSKSYLNQ